MMEMVMIAVVYAIFIVLIESSLRATKKMKPFIAAIVIVIVLSIAMMLSIGITFLYGVTIL